MLHWRFPGRRVGGGLRYSKTRFLISNAAQTLGDSLRLTILTKSDFCSILWESYCRKEAQIWLIRVSLDRGLDVSRSKELSLENLFRATRQFGIVCCSRLAIEGGMDWRVSDWVSLRSLR